jgi:hypothetical protein
MVVWLCGNGSWKRLVEWEHELLAVEGVVIPAGVKS